MTETPARSPTASDGVQPAADSPPLAPDGAPLCYVVDEESSIRHFLSLVLHGSGVDTVEFPDGAAMRKAIETRAPALVFHNISLESTDAIESVVALGKLRYRGAVQLMSARGAAVLEHVKAIGAQHKLQMMPVLKKPFETDTIVKIIQELKLGMPPAVAARLELDDAINNKWIEFWYQPKIALRKKQLAGAEAYARVRHPQHGLVLPGAFTASASDASTATAGRTRAGKRTQDQRPLFEAWGQPAALGQYPRAGACENSRRRHREEAPSGRRKMARTYH